MKKSKNNLKKITIMICLLIVTLTALVLLQITRSEIISNVVDLEVGFDSELKYTLSVSYDGVDRNGEKSKDGKITKINSDYIYVEDVLPEGLIFEKFDVEGSDNQSIGAMPKYELSTGSCTGHVENDSIGSTDPKNNHGLHYDESTRKVSFKVKNLSAGCKINIVIVTKTPEEIEGNRKEFYNTATAWEGTQLVYSNTVHAFIQKIKVNTNTVTYQFTGTKPDDIEAPPSQEYAEGSIVTLANVPKVEGYEFLGWQVLEPLSLVINKSDTQFEMPNANVVLQGTFKELPKYNVSYKIEGEAPSGYILPLSKQYYEDATVKFDGTKSGDTFNGYRFLGWTINGDAISDSDFRMPAKDIEVIGRWEQIKYKVEFKFIGDVVPSEGDSLLPSPSEYVPGESVTIENIEDVEGYGFVGWNYDYEFIMPEHDVVIYGEWMIKNGVFTPEIKKEINNPKDYYYPGDIVNYTITVTNTADYPIKNVIVRDNNEKATLNIDIMCSDIVESNNNNFMSNGIKQCKKSNHIVQINYIGANSSAKINARYLVTDEDIGIITNEVEILGASADNNYVLDQEKEYKSEVSFKVASQIKICKTVTNDSKTGDVFRFHIENETYDGWLKLSNGECKSIYLAEDTYKVSEVIPQEYNLESVTLTRDGSTSNVENGVEITTDSSSIATLTFENKYKKKPYYHSSGTVENRVLASAKSDYVVNYYFDEELVSTEKGSGALGESIPYNADKNSTYNGRHYALDKIVGENKVISSNSEDNIIDVYYALDVLVDPSLPKQEGGDGVPDKYQVVVTFVVKNGTWDGLNSADINNVLTKYKNGVPSEDGSNILGGIIPVGMVPNAGYTAIGSCWDEAIGAETIITRDVIYTFTFPVTTSPIDPNPDPGGTPIPDSPL